MIEQRFAFDIDIEHENDEPFFYNETDSFYVNNSDEMELFIKEINKLAEENKELKEEKRSFDSLNHNWALLYDEATSKVEELSEENKELKHRIKQLEDYRESATKCIKEVEDFFERHEIDTVNFHILDTLFEMSEFYYDKCNDVVKDNERLQYLLDEAEKELKEYKDFMSLG